MPSGIRSFELDLPSTGSSCDSVRRVAVQLILPAKRIVRYIDRRRKSCSGGVANASHSHLTAALPPLYSSYAVCRQLVWGKLIKKAASSLLQPRTARVPGLTRRFGSAVVRRALGDKEAREQSQRRLDFYVQMLKL